MARPDGAEPMRALADIAFVVGVVAATYAVLRDGDRRRTAIGLIVGLVLVAAGLAAGATSARATTLTGEHPNMGRLQAHVAWVQAQGRLPLPATEVAVSPDMELCRRPDDAGITGCALWDGTTIVLRPMGRSDRVQQRQTLVHELGHLYDFTYMTDEDRAWFTARLYLDGHAWWNEGPYKVRPGEMFAAAYTFCQLRPRAIRWFAPFRQKGKRFYGQQLLDICRKVRQIYRRGPVSGAGA